MAVVLAVTSFGVVGLTSITASAAYNFNYATAGTSYESTVPSVEGGTDKPSDYLQAQFNFDNTLDGVDGSGNKIAMTKQNGEITLASGLLGRKNVAQFTTVNTPGSYADAASNPLAGKINGTDGATVTFWHYQQHYKENSNYKFIPVVTFYTDRYHYVAFSYGGYMLYADGAYTGNGIFRDYRLNSQDSDIVGIPSDSTTITASSNEDWCHYAFAVTDSSLSVYICGVRYDWSTTDGGTTPYTGQSSLAHPDTNTEDYSDILSHVINFIGSSSINGAEVKMSIGYQPFEQAGYTFTADDVRLYNKALTQLQIRSLYGENDSSIYDYAEGHDPTVVENQNYGTSGHEKEYRYYMFGTGMTIYGSNDLSNWDELGDSQSRTGYQNEEYWGIKAADGTVSGANYMDVLRDGTTYNRFVSSDGTVEDVVGASPLKYSSQDNKSTYSNSDYGNGNGKVVWAPSVYYNTTNQKYMMVCATSSWSSPVSCIFTAEADSIEGPYYNVYALLYSGFHENGSWEDYKTGVARKLVDSGYATTKQGDPNTRYLNSSWGKWYYKEENYPNCIDPCPFYAADGNLYMSYGSCEGHIWMVRLRPDGRSTDEQWMYSNGHDPYFGKMIIDNTAETGGSIKNSGEGSFCYYDKNTNQTYINASFGFVHRGYYTMRVWSNKSSCPMTGDFTDIIGNKSTTENTDTVKSGMKLMGNYAIPGSGIKYYDNGHCSYLRVSSNATNEADKLFIAYHTRIEGSMLSERAAASTNYLNEARVHQVIYNEYGQQCVLPYQYSGETFDKTTSLASSIPGYFSIIDHGTDVKNTYLSGTSYILLPDSEGASTGTVSDQNGNAAGTWSLAADNDLTIVIDGATYSGVMLKMNDEQGNERLVFSATGVSTINTIWGVQTGIYNDNVKFSNPDADLQLDPKAFVHGDETGEHAGVANAYYGTTLEDGTYSSAEACEIRIAKGWTIDTIQNADDSLNGSFTTSALVSSTDTYNVYYLTGTVPTDPNDVDGKGYDLALNITYHKDANPGISYTEEVYTWVMSSKIEAHATAASSRGDYRSVRQVWENQRSAGLVFKLQGSLGSATQSGSQTNGSDNQYGVGNYRSVGNFQSKANWSSENSEVNNSTHALSYAFDLNADKKAGLFATYQGTTSKNDAAATSGVGKATGSYYLDMSLAGRSDRLPSGVSIDSSGNWSVTVPIAGVPQYFEANTSQFVSNVAVSGGSKTSPPVWSATSDTTYVNSTPFRNAASGTLAYALRCENQGDVPTQVYNSTLSGNGTQTDIKLEIKVVHDGIDASPRATASGEVYANVYVYDKSETRTALEAATSNDVTSDEFYTVETWARYNEAIRVANAYVNNEMNTTTSDSITVVSGGNEYIITPQGVTKNGDGSFFVSADPNSTAQAVFAEWITARHDQLFPSSLYESFTDKLTQATEIELTNGSEYTESSFAAFTAIYDRVTQDYAQFSTGSFTTSEETSWRDINDYGIDGAAADNYNPLDTSLTAKENYQNAVYNLEIALASLRKKADYDGLSTEISSSANVTAQKNQLYTENTGDFYFELNLGGDETTVKDIQNYTISSWVPYDAAYTAASTTLSAKTVEDKMFADKEVTVTNAADSTQTTTVASDDIVEASGAVTGNYSTLQTKIYDETTALNTAVGQLTAPDSDDAYTNYDTSQVLASYADLDAYTDDGAVITSNLETYKTQSTAPAYSADDAKSVYVTYGGTLFKNTASGQLDAITTAVLTGINGGKRTYTVTLNIYLDNALSSTPVDKEAHTYGDIVNLTPAAPLNAVVEKWVVTKTDDAGAAIGEPTTVHNNADTYSTKIQANTVVDAYFVTDGTVAESTAKKVTVLDYFDKPIDVYYVADGAQIEVNGSTLTCGSNVTSALGSPYYTFLNWSFAAGDKTENISSGTYTVTADTVITQYGTKLSDAFAYTIAGGTFADGKITATYAIDDKVSIALSDSTGFIGWAMCAEGDTTNYTIISYNPTYTFLAYAHDTDIIAVTSDNVAALFTDADTAAKVTEKLPLSFGYGMFHPGEASKNKFSLYCNFTEGVNPDKAKIVECGVVYTTDSSLATNDSMIKGTAGVNTRISSSQSDSCQYMMSKTNADTGTYFMRSYVSYIYITDVNGTVVNVPRTEYGPIVKCNSGTIS